MTSAVRGLGHKKRHRATLVIAPDLRFYSEHPKPSRWVRFWHRFLLGWNWEDPQ